MLQLRNEFLTVDIESSASGYVGSRFDYNGKVVQISDSKGNTFLTQERLRNSDTQSLGKGLFGEFGIDKAIGYETCAVGDFFPKIGVGLLQKISNNPYDFFFPYQVTPFATSIKKLSDSEIVFECSNDSIAYPFYYRKSLTLKDNSLNLHYFIENRGDKSFETNEYIHNFLSFNHEGVGKDLKLNFQSSIDSEAFSLGLNPDRVLEFETMSLKSVHFNDKPSSDFFFDSIIKESAHCSKWTVCNEAGLSISEQVDFKPSKINLWGAAHVVSPEIFHNFIVHPMCTLEWNRTIEVSTP